MQSYDVAPNQRGWALVLHGGAGGRVEELTLEARGSYTEGLERAYEAGAAVLSAGGSALDAVCATVEQLEDDPLFNAGRGAALTAAGTAELDACVMTGDGRAGAITASRHARNPVYAARKVMEETPAVLLVAPTEARLLDRELATDCRKRARDEVAAAREPRALQLRCRVVVVVEHVVDLDDQLQPLDEIVADADVHDAISRCRTWSEIVGIVRLVGIVLVSACERTGCRNQVEVDREFRHHLNIRKRLEHVSRNKGDAIAGRDLDRAFQACALIVCAVARAVDRLPALKRRVQPGVTGATS